MIYPRIFFVEFTTSFGENDKKAGINHPPTLPPRSGIYKDAKQIYLSRLFILEPATFDHPWSSVKQMITHAQFMHRIDKDTRFFWTDIRCDAVTEVKYVARALAIAVENNLNFLTGTV